MSELALTGNGMVMPSKYVEIDREEMTYIEGGATTVLTGTYASLKNSAAARMAAWASLALGYSYSAAAAATTGIGLPITVVAGLGAAYCSFVANEFRNAYNFFSTKNSTLKGNMTIITFCSLITGVNVK